MKKNISVLLGVILSIIVLVPGTCYGASYDYCSKLPDELKEANGCLSGVSDYEDLTKNTVKTVITNILYVAGILAIIVLIYGGFTYITSAGDMAKVNRGKTIIISAAIGIVITVLAYAIVNFVFNAIKSGTAGI